MAEATASQPLAVGARIKFRGEVQRYTVQAASPRYAICTKPFNARKTVIYTIIDFERAVRGRDDRVLGMGYGTRQDCERNLKAMLAPEHLGPVGVSKRHCVPLDIEAVTPPGRPERRR